MSQNNVLPDEVIAAPIKPKRKSPVIGILIAIAVIALVAIAGYAWYTTSGPCGTKPVAAAVQSLAEVHDDFDDYYKIRMRFKKYLRCLSCLNNYDEVLSESV